MPLCLATLTLFIQEKSMHFIIGTGYIFDKTGWMTLFIPKNLLFNYRGGSLKINRSLVANYDCKIMRRI